MTNNNLIDRMARAIHAASYHPTDKDSPIVQEHYEEARNVSLARARAALDALNPAGKDFPEDDWNRMVEAGRKYEADDEVIFIGMIFHEMIKAAKEGEG